MKTILLFICVVCSLPALAQLPKVYYKPGTAQCYVFHGTQESADSIVSIIGDVGNVVYNSVNHTATFDGNIAFAGQYVCNDMNVYGVSSETIFNKLYSIDSNVLSEFIYNKTQADSRYLQSESDPLFNTKFATKTSDNLTEGSTNKYFTTSSFNTALGTKTTDNLNEGSLNKYATTTNIRAASSAGSGISYSSGVIANTLPDQTVVLTGSNGISTTGTYPNFTIAKSKRQETYTVTTNASASGATATVTFGTAYNVAPVVIATLPNSSINRYVAVTTVSTTGFTVNTWGINLLALGTQNIGSLIVDVLVTEK